MTDSEKGFHILVAEDDGINRFYISTILKKNGYRVSGAGNGREAVESVLTDKPDLVLMDINMPELNGMDATRTIREHEKEAGAHRTPVIALTAHAFKEELNACLEAGMDDFISKPFTEKEVLRLIETRLTV
jgi:CheY-like chemotaxis protein